MNKNANQSRFCSKEGFRKGVILSLTQDLRRLSLQLQLCNNVRGRRQIKSAMTPLLNKRGFTLIELLVVVLIIGILAAVAMPQYRVAVEKARVTEALTNISNIQKAIEIWVLEKGFPSSVVQLIGDATTEDHISNQLDIELENIFVCDQDDGNYCRSKNFAYDAQCATNGCSIRVVRCKDGDFENSAEYIMELEYSANGEWSKLCGWVEVYPYSTSLCTGLVSQGWNVEEY